MKLKLVILTLSLVQMILTSAAIAATNVTVRGKVTRIYPEANGDIRFRVDIETNNCSLKNSNHDYRIPQNYGTFDETYALLLAAAYTGKSVLVRHDNEACNVSKQVTDITYVYQDFDN